jgi:hypothetical protein
VRREDCMDMFKRIPEVMHAQVNLVLRNGFVISVDGVVRFEDAYVVIRGREGGTSDEGRGFFVPFDEICYVRIERPLRLGELKLMYGETGFMDLEDRLAAQGEALAEPAKQTKSPSDTPMAPMPTPPPSTTPTPVATATDPASIAKQNLLDRIRAARANVAGATGRLGNSGK